VKLTSVVILGNDCVNDEIKERRKVWGMGGGRAGKKSKSAIAPEKPLDPPPPDEIDAFVVVVDPESTHL
jgi:hypothetical protein